MIARCERSIGSDNREYYSKNNDTKKFFSRENLEEKWEGNRKKMVKVSREHEGRNKKIRGEEEELNKNEQRIKSKNYKKGAKIDREIMETNNCGLKIERVIGQEEEKNNQISISLGKKYIQLTSEVQAMSLEKKMEEKSRNDEDRTKIKIKKVKLKKKITKPNAIFLF